MRFGLFGTGPWAHLAHAPGRAAHGEVEFAGVWASPWRRESGGLWDVGSHAVSEVAAMTAPRDMSYPLLRHASGAVSQITLSVDVPPAAAREEALFAGEAGIRSVPAVPWEPIAAYGQPLDQLIAAAAGRSRSLLDIRFGAEVTSVLAAAEEAARSGRTVAVSG